MAGPATHVGCCAATVQAARQSRDDLVAAQRELTAMKAQRDSMRDQLQALQRAVQALTQHQQRQDEQLRSLAGGVHTASGACSAPADAAPGAASQPPPSALDRRLEAVSCRQAQLDAQLRDLLARVAGMEAAAGTAQPQGSADMPAHTAGMDVQHPVQDQVRELRLDVIGVRRTIESIDMRCTNTDSRLLALERNVQQHQQPYQHPASQQQLLASQTLSGLPAGAGAQAAARPAQPRASTDAACAPPASGPALEGIKHKRGMCISSGSSDTAGAPAGQRGRLPLPGEPAAKRQRLANAARQPTAQCQQQEPGQTLGAAKLAAASTPAAPGKPRVRTRGPSKPVDAKWVADELSRLVKAPTADQAEKVPARISSALRNDKLEQGQLFQGWVTSLLDAAHRPALPVLAAAAARLGELQAGTPGGMTALVQQLQQVLASSLLERDGEPPLAADMAAAGGAAMAALCHENGAWRGCCSRNTACRTVH